MFVSLVAAAALVGFIVYAVTMASRRSSTSSSVTLVNGAAAPAFSLERLGGGPPVRLASLAAGRPAVVNFFASWCPNCRAELAAFGAAARSDGGRIAFIGVDSNDTNPRLARSLLAAAGDHYPVGVDSNGMTAVNYLVPGFPTTVFLDRRGRVVNETVGALSAGQLARDLALLRTGAGT